MKAWAGLQASPSACPSLWPKRLPYPNVYVTVVLQTLVNTIDFGMNPPKLLPHRASTPSGRLTSCA